MRESEQEIMSKWRGSISTPLVSILCITYNHVKYIGKTIDSFLMQDLDYPFEVIVHDDASSDGTSEVLRRYQMLYPNIIKPIIQEENQFSKGVVIINLLKKQAVGKYLAYCEGDDYWTDSSKLRRQCEYLDKHPQIVVTGHDSCSIGPDGEIIKKSRLQKRHQRDFSAEEMSTGKAWMLNLTLVFRNVDFGDIPESARMLNNDKFLVALLGNYGGSHFHPEIKPACHIAHAGGLWSSMELAARNEAQINSWFWIYKYYKRVGKDEYAEAFWNMYLRRVFAQSSRLALIKELLIRLLYLRELASMLKNLK
ncbi:glycosyltransferase family 2 protein [Billgrantia lactosivorans]|uniref:glycosyltransferase family 2 protein n=1 Tax=Billgrantia lactosivorans TaxID=2185141 RepID=UPI000DACE816|nr:glycosyltransferase family 2 protein [Halomonas lactosivorans]